MPGAFGVRSLASAPCSWCGQPAPSWPSVFCWTKMQAEAGQSLAEILQRKNRERSAGDGVFFWGIGNSLGAKIKDLLRYSCAPVVVFSTMRSRPRPEDVSPDGVLCWTGYLDDFGTRHTLPQHVMVLSRARTATGPKKRHYALVCRSTSPLTDACVGRLPLGHFRNLGSASSRVGASQVTAIVEHQHPICDGPTYDINFATNLVSPYCVQLIDPVPFVPEGVAKYLPNASNPQTMTEWMSLSPGPTTLSSSRLSTRHPC
jgi:hypothetical protein